jgi:hypothetical protein
MSKKTESVSPVIFSTVLYSGSLSNYNEVKSMFGRLNVVSFSMKYPSEVSSSVYNMSGIRMLHRLMNNQKKRGVYHTEMENPVRIKQSPQKIAKKCTTVKDESFETSLQNRYSVCLSLECDIPSGLYECSVTLKVSDHNWDIYPFISCVEEKSTEHTCPACHGELTLDVIRCVELLPSDKIETRNLFSSIHFVDGYVNMIQLPESVKTLIADFKKTFEI